MQRFSTWARWISAGLAVAFFIVKEVALPVVVDFIKQQPETNDFLHVVLKYALDFAQQSWVHIAAWILIGFVVGLWAAAVLQKLDATRADSRKIFGAEMVRLGNYLEQLKFPMQESAQIKSCFATAKKLGLWVPDERIFRLHPPRASHEVTNYLKHVGTMLKDGNFRQAKRDAKNSKAAFDKAYAQHRLT
jgi:hypothetical protein